MDGLSPCPVVLLISADIEWRALRQILPDVDEHTSPLGEFFYQEIQVRDRPVPVLFFHGGWGKIAAGASTQYVIDRWSPSLLVNLGTCGGFEGEIDKGEVILVERTIVYDIIEQMGDFDEHIAHYATNLDLSWLAEPLPQEVRRGLLVSADRDLLVEDLPQLKERYGAVAGDWESGAIAWVARRNGVRCLILRGVTDLVGSGGGEAYDGNLSVFEQNAARVLDSLVKYLEEWLAISLPAFQDETVE